MGIREPGYFFFFKYYLHKYCTNTKKPIDLEGWDPVGPVGLFKVSKKHILKNRVELKPFT